MKHLTEDQLTGLERLEQLAKFDPRTVKADYAFDFDEHNGSANPISYDENGCGTVGCKLGQCPLLWGEWIYSENHFLPILKDTTFCTVDPIEESAMLWFSLTESEVLHLFYPDCQNTNWSDLLVKTSTEEQVNAHILRFVEQKRNGEIN